MAEVAQVEEERKVYRVKREQGGHVERSRLG